MFPNGKHCLFTFVMKWTRILPVHSIWFTLTFTIGIFSGSNGMGSRQDPQQKKPHNYKLIIDPMIHRGGQKIYRFDGIDPAVRNNRKS